VSPGFACSWEGQSDRKAAFSPLIPPPEHEQENRHMAMLKLVAGLAVGYVLGSRAGREKYEQIAATARKVNAHPTVVQAQEKAKALISTGTDKATAKLHSAAVAAEPATVAPATVAPATVAPATTPRPARPKPAPITGQPPL
jgi:hypothetical protein